jgi:hypothetical protein
MKTVFKRKLSNKSIWVFQQEDVLGKQAIINYVMGKFEYKNAGLRMKSK